MSFPSLNPMIREEKCPSTTRIRVKLLLLASRIAPTSSKKTFFFIMILYDSLEFIIFAMYVDCMASWKRICSSDQNGFSGNCQFAVLSHSTFIFLFFSLFFPCVLPADNDNYNDTYYYLDSGENVTDTIMPNSTSPQDNILITATGWSEFNGGNSTDMPLDMVFNDGHRLSIAVYRYYMRNQTNIINLIANRICCYCCYC